MKIFFDEIQELSDPDRRQRNYHMFKAQKGSKDVVKIVHLTSVSIFINFMKLRE